MVHFDIKRLACIVRPGSRVTGQMNSRARGAGFEYLHTAIDDHSRISFAAMLPDQTHRSAIRFFLMAREHFNRFGFDMRRVYSDNGPCYRHLLYRQTVRQLNMEQRFTRPYTPRTNGKAERFIQTALREWAYARTYQNSAEREQQLHLWLHDYNFHRPHASLKLNTPASRAALERNNLLTLHTYSLFHRNACAIFLLAFQRTLEQIGHAAIGKSRVFAPRHRAGHRKCGQRRGRAVWRGDCARRMHCGRGREHGHRRA
jgi:hypothetical protein